MSTPIQTGNPWLTIWLKPRETIASIVKFNPKYRLWVLAVLSGLPMLLHFSQGALLGKEHSVLGILIAIALFSFLSGILTITVGSLLCFWTGKWIGGKATFSTTRTAVAWSNAPHLVTILMWVLLIVAFKETLFNGQYLETQHSGLQLTLIGAGLVQFVCSIWSMVILVKGLAEVQGFSAWKGLLNVVLAVVVVFLLLWVLALLLTWASKGMPS